MQAILGMINLQPWLVPKVQGRGGCTWRSSGGPLQLEVGNHIAASWGTGHRSAWRSTEGCRPHTRCEKLNCQLLLWIFTCTLQERLVLQDRVIRILTRIPVPRCKEHRRHREQPSSAWIPWSGQWEDRFLSWHGSWWWQCPGRWRLQGWIHWWTGMGGSRSQLLEKSHFKNVSSILVSDTKAW